MGLTINKVQKSSGRTSLSEDLLSGLQFYGTAPSVAGKWNNFQSSIYPTVQIKAQQLFSLDDATAAGILPNTENTASTSKYVISTLGTTGDTVNISVTVPILGGTTSALDLGTYTVNAVTETTIALQGAAWAAVINAGTFQHGWVASFTTATLTLTAPKSYGKYLNTGSPFTYTIGGNAIPTFAGAITQNVIPGTVSQYAIWYYQISEFFKNNSNNNLWVGIISASSSFKELLALQSASGNTLRQIGVYDNETSRSLAANIVATALSLQTIALVLDQVFPFEILYSGNITAVSDLSTMPNGQLVKYNKVSVVISQDGKAAGNLLYVVSGQTIGNIGAKLKTTSISRVSADDAQAIDSFNVSDGVENDIPAFGNGKLLSEITSSLQTQLSNFRYIFFQVFTGNTPGTFWNDNHNFCDQTYRYAYMNDNRIASKITRICQKVYVPQLKAEIIYKDDGTISDFSIEMLQDAGVDAITADCITGFGSMPLISGAPIVTIDPTQELQQTNNLDIVVQVGENGIARNITIAQGFTN